MYVPRQRFLQFLQSKIVGHTPPAASSFRLPPSHLPFSPSKRLCHAFPSHQVTEFFFQSIPNQSPTALCSQNIQKYLPPAVAGYQGRVTKKLGNFASIYSSSLFGPNQVLQCFIYDRAVAWILHHSIQGSRIHHLKDIERRIQRSCNSFECGQGSIYICLSQSTMGEHRQQQNKIISLSSIW